MEAVERMKRVQKVLALMGWWHEHNDNDDITIQLNKLRPLGTESPKRSEIIRPGKWIGIWGGHTFSGDSPDEVAIQIEKKVFGAILEGLDGHIANAEKLVQNKKDAKRIILDAMKSL